MFDTSSTAEAIASRQPLADLRPALLVVDDEPTVLSALEAILSDSFEECAVLTAASAEEAFALFSRNTISVLITDLKLPQKSGLDLIRQIRRFDEAPSCLLMTAYGSNGIAAEATSLGTLAYVEKPFQAEHLLKYIRYALSSSALMQIRDAHWNTDSSGMSGLNVDFGEGESANSDVIEKAPTDIVLDQKTPLDEDVERLTRDLVSLGVSHFRSKQLSRAEKCWQLALRYDPGCVAARCNLLILDKVKRSTEDCH